MPKKNNTFLPKLRRFIDVQIWIQQLRFKALKWWYFVEIFETLIDRTWPIFSSFLQGLVINEVVRVALATEKNLTHLLQIIAIQQGIYLLRRIIQFAYDRNYWLLSQRQFTLHLQNEFLVKVSGLNWEHIETPETEKHINIMMQRAWSHIQQAAAIHFEIIAIIIGAIFAFQLGQVPWYIVAFVIAKNIPYAVLDVISSKLMYAFTDRRLADNMQIEWIFSYFRDFKTLLEIKISNAATPLITLRDKIVQVINKDQWKTQHKTTPPYIFALIFDIATTAGVALYYMRKVIFEGMQIGTFNFTTSAVFNVGDSFSRVLRRINQLTEGYRYVKHAYLLMHLENKQPDGDIEFSGDYVKIEFKDVWFKYPASEAWALKGVSFTIEDNDRIAIVGENGAGKSTFLKLLMLAYYPTKGQILINDIPVEKYKKSSLYNAISLVSQEFAQFGAQTIAQNIAIYGDIENIQEEKMQQAAEYSTASDFIEKLPKKYDTVLTKRIEGGTELSTGQWQRIAIARQFYGNRPLVVLDEPTASIDPIAEGKIFSNLYTHVKNKTVIVVSHRYNTVQSAKKILVFQDGQIIENGTHKSLLEANGYYAKAYKVQQEEKEL